MARVSFCSSESSCCLSAPPRIRPVITPQHRCRSHKRRGSRSRASTSPGGLGKSWPSGPMDLAILGLSAEEAERNLMPVCSHLGRSCHRSECLRPGPAFSSTGKASQALNASTPGEKEQSRTGAFPLHCTDVGQAKAGRLEAPQEAGPFLS